MPGLQRRQAPIKQVLLAGDVVVGVGNIYASEALFLRRHPPDAGGRAHQPAARGAPARTRCARSWRGRVERGGSTLRDFSNVDGQSGYFQLEAMVYGRAGEPCRVCATPIRPDPAGPALHLFLPASARNDAEGVRTNGCRCYIL